MRYNTGNPVGPDGSSSPFDLHDNAGIMDLLLTGPLGEYLNRLGVPLKSWRGLMQQVTDYLLAQGYESTYLVYGAGVVVQRQTQLVQRAGELYRVMSAADIPLTLTGTWATDAPKLQGVGDLALRQALASSGGAEMVGLNNSNVSEQLSTLPLSRAVYDVIIAYGQSNSVGIGANTAGYPASVHPKARAYNPVTGSIIPLSKGLISSAGQTSTGHQYAAFANEYIKLTGRGVVIVSCGLGGTDIATLAKPGAPANTIYDKMLAAVADTVAKMGAAGLTVGNRYALWNHGEQDALIGTVGSNYRAALNTLIGNMVTDLGLTRFGVSVLASCTDYTAPGRVQRIQRVQQELAKTRLDTVVVSRSQLGFSAANGMMQSDNAHYFQRAYNLVGEEIAESLAQLNTSDLSETSLGMAESGVVTMNPRHVGQLTFARAKKTSASGTNTWALYDDADTGGSYTISNIEPTLAVFGSGVRMALQSRFPMLAQENVYVPKSLRLLDVSMATSVTDIDSANGLFGILCEPFISPRFAISNTGVITVPGATADVLAVINGAVQVTVTSANVVKIAYKGLPGCYSHPMLAVSGAGAVALSGLSLTEFTVTFSGGSTSAIVSLQNVPLPAASLPAGAEFSISYIMGSRLD